MSIKRGDIILVDLEPVVGSEQGKIRPCLVVQENVSNKYSPTTIIAAISSKFSDKDYPTEVIVNHPGSGLDKVSVILCNQIRTISVKDRIIKKIGALSSDVMSKVDEALKNSLGLD